MVMQVKMHLHTCMAYKTYNKTHEFLSLISDNEPQNLFKRIPPDKWCSMGPETFN